jgi:hypothetical protein
VGVGASVMTGVVGDFSRTVRGQGALRYSPPIASRLSR